MRIVSRTKAFFKQLLQGSPKKVIWKRRIDSLTWLSEEELQRLHVVKKRLCKEFYYEEPDAEDLIVEAALAPNFLM